jgi:hypothetical protein
MYAYFVVAENIDFNTSLGWSGSVQIWIVSISRS